jgi:predicted RNA-binding Zn ribbon-like protein
MVIDGGAACVDFALTDPLGPAPAGGPGPAPEEDILVRGEALAEWLAGSPLATPRSLAVEDGDLRQAGAFRTAALALLRAAASGERPPRGPRSVVNQVAAAPSLVPRLGDGGRRWVPPASAEQALATLARELIDILSGPQAARIRQCAAEDCDVVFLDSSRAGSRRWCSMERCGNREKVRAFRQRRTP